MDYQTYENTSLGSEVREIYLKLTDNCNLKCLHCYNGLHTKGKDANMTKETLESVVSFVEKYVSTVKETVIVNFHGGEPLCYPIDDLVTIANRLSTFENVKLSMTTNLVYLLTDKHYQLFRLFRPNDDKPFIQTSWDYHIRFKGKQESLWKTNVSELIEKGIDVQPTVCVSKPLIENVSPSELFDNMVGLGIKNLNFERLTRTGNAELNDYIVPLNREMDNWLLEAYKVSREKSVFVPLFRGVELSFNGNFKGCRARNCSKRVLTFNRDGSICGCPNTTYRPFGRIGEDVLNVESDKLLTEQKKEQTIHLDCLLCKHYRCCNGDCYQLEHDERGCGGLYNLYEYISKEGIV